MGAFQSTPKETLTHIWKLNEMEAKLLKDAKKYSTDRSDSMKTLPPAGDAIAPYLGNLRTLYLIQKYQNNLCYLPGIMLDLTLTHKYYFSRAQKNLSFDRLKEPSETNNPFRTENFDHKQLAKLIRETRNFCLDNQILVIDLTIAFTKKNYHAVVLIINEETFEYYDPQSGPRGPDNIINSKLEPVADELQLQYVSALEVCPVGPQAYEVSRKYPLKKGDPRGFCVDWSNLYIQLRLQFPEKSGREITDTFLNFIDDHRINIRDFIRGMSRRYSNYDIIIKHRRRMNVKYFDNLEEYKTFITYDLPYLMKDGIAKIVPKKRSPTILPSDIWMGLM
jgi:hypothetical protein